MGAMVPRFNPLQKSCGCPWPGLKQKLGPEHRLGQGLHLLACGQYFDKPEIQPRARSLMQLSQ